jgi:hypothetical protein
MTTAARGNVKYCAAFRNKVGEAPYPPSWFYPAANHELSKLIYDLPKRDCDAIYV